MPGLLAVCWSPDHAEQGTDLFHRTCGAYAKVKGLACSAQYQNSYGALARFPGPFSQCPQIEQAPDHKFAAVSAGWWFDPDTPENQAPHLSLLQVKDPSQRERMLDRLQGQYVVAIADASNESITIAGDGLGLFPLYVAMSDGVALACTSSVALALVLQAPLDTESLRALFVTDAIRPPRTAFAGIRRTLLGERLVLKKGRVEVQRTWKPFKAEASYRRIEDAAQHGLSLIQQSCRRMHQLWPHWIADLTAGLDSRVTAAGLSTLGVPVHVTVNGTDQDLDVIIARRIAKTLDWPLRHFQLPDNWGQQRWLLFQEGVCAVEGELAGSAVDGTIHVKRQLAKSFQASLSGGGGELYRDFFWQQEFWNIGRTSRLDLPRLFRYRFGFAARPRMDLFQRDWRADYLHDQLQTAQSFVDLVPDALNTAKLDAVYLWKSVGHFGRYAAAAYPTIATPTVLMTPALVEFLLAVPWRYRTGGKLVRHIITQANPRLASFRTWYGSSAEPLRIMRPDNYLPHAWRSFQKLVRKMGQLTVHRSIFRDPCTQTVNPRVHPDFASVLAREGFLDVNNLQTAGLYHEAGLRAFLQQVRQPDFNDYNQLYAIATVECLARVVGLPPGQKTF